MFSDWKKAIWRAPLHMLGSLPVAGVSLLIPPIGKTYLAWRTKAEAADVAAGRDTPEKGQIDLYTQTALVVRVLNIWGS
jgi:hypothetical protein